MNPLIKKIKHVFLIWLGTSLAGGFAISFGLEPKVCAYVALMWLALCYYASQKIYFSQVPVEENLSVETEAKDFISEVENLKQRASQIYLMKSQADKSIDQAILNLHYKHALFLTIANAGETSVNVYFSALFSNELSETKEYHKTPSVDQLVLDLTSRSRRTRLQDEYLSFLAFDLSARDKPVEEISLVYTIDHGRLKIRRPFDNIIGKFFIRMLSLIEVNSRILRMHDLFKLDPKDLRK